VRQAFERRWSDDWHRYRLAEHCGAQIGCPAAQHTWQQARPLEGRAVDPQRHIGSSKAAFNY
jgi:hypothetical protein